MQNTISEKPTLAQLLNRHRINMIRLAQVTSIHVDVVRAMVQHVPVQPIIVLAVLHGLHLLTGTYYRLEDVNIALVPPSYVIGSIHVGREDLEESHTTTVNDRRG